MVVSKLGISFLRGPPFSGAKMLVSGRLLLTKYFDAWKSVPKICSQVMVMIHIDKSLAESNPKFNDETNPRKEVGCYWDQPQCISIFERSLLQKMPSLIHISSMSIQLHVTWNLAKNILWIIFGSLTLIEVSIFQSMFLSSPCFRMFNVCSVHSVECSMILLMEEILHHRVCIKHYKTV